MRQRNTLIKWLAVAGVTLGLNVQALAGMESGGPKNRQPRKDSALVVIKKSPSSVNPQIVSVSDEKKVASSRQEPLYRPPQRGAPGGRVGGGTRGPSTELPLLWALVPDHVGLSTNPQPLLVWYLSKATVFPLEFTIIEEMGVTPLLEKRISSPDNPGMHIIQLADYDLELEKGKTYQWFVSLISDPEHRSSDIITGGMIQVSDVPSSLGEEARTASPVEAARIWAQAGFWYDAIGVISTNLQAHPSDSEMHDLRASLLEEVDLDMPAQVDRQHGL